MSLLCFSAMATGLAMTEQKFRPEEGDQGKKGNARGNQEAEETNDDGARAEKVLKHVSCLQREASRGESHFNLYSVADSCSRARGRKGELRMRQSERMR